MKLTFFEKNLFDQSAREKPAISTNDSQKTDLDNIKSDFTKQYKSEALEKTVRQIKIPIEYLPFYSDGEKFTGKIKKTDITSGEREIVSTVDAPGRQLPIDVEFYATARLRTQQQIEQQNPNISFNNVRGRENKQFEPFISISAGNVLNRFLRGFADTTRFINSFSGGLRTLRSAYYRFLNLLNSSSAILSENVFNDNFRNGMPESELPEEISKKEIITQENDIDTYQRQIAVTYDFLTNPVMETEFWKLRHLSKKVTNSYKNFSLHQRKLIMPVFQKVEYSGTPYQVKSASDSNPIINNISESIRAYAPFDIPEPESFFRNTPEYSPDRSDITVTISNLVIPPNPNTEPNYNNDVPITFNASIKVNGHIGFFNNYNGSDYLYESAQEILAWRNSLYSASLISIIGNTINITSGGTATYHSQFPDPTISSVSNDLIRYFKRWFNLRPTLNWLESAFSNPANKVGYSPPNIGQLKNPENPLLRHFPAIPAPAKSDIGIAETENSVYANSKRIGALGFSHQNLSGSFTPRAPDGSISKTSYFNLSPNINFNPIDLIQSGDDQETDPEDRIKARLLPIDISGQSGNYKIVDVDFSENLIYIEQASQENFIFEPLEPGRAYVVKPRITQITITMPNRMPTIISVNLQIAPEFNRKRAQFRSTILTNLLKYNKINVLGRNSWTDVRYFNQPVNNPNIAYWLFQERPINNFQLSLEIIKRNLRPDPLNFSIAITGEGQTQPEEQEAQNLIQGSVSPSFPWVTIPLLEYREGRIYIEMERHPNAPVPNKRFFDSVSIAGRKFNFSQSRYNKALGFAEYSWPTPIDFIEGKTFIPLIFKKKGTSYTDDQSYSRLVQKSTVQTIEKKEIPKLLGGFKVVDFDFDTTKFKISFSGIIPASAFQSIAVLDKNNIENITRQMRTADATRSVDDNITTFEWNNLPDFFSLHRNKEYTLEMIKGANNEVLDFFIPRPLKSGFHIVNDVKFEDDDLKLFLDIFGSEVEDSPFISVKILNPNGTDFMTSKQEKSGIKTVSGKEMDYTFKNAVTGLRALVSGDKFDLAFSVKDFPSFELNFTKMTDIFFDTLVILNTNIDDINIKNQLDNELIHPSDVQVFKSETENGLRHIVLMLNNPVTAGQIRLVNRRLFGSDKSRAIGQIYCLKKIGDFSKLPVVQPNLNQGKIATLDQYNRAHVKSFPPAINYSLTFLPLETKEDIALAQDLFLRLADYNEFMIWVSGGDIIKNRQGVRGFRFVDIIKALCVNEENIVFSDGRISSGVTFNMEIAQVQ